MPQETVEFVISGSRAEVERFLRSLKSEPELKPVSEKVVPHPLGPNEEEPFGQVEIVDLIIHFGIAFTAHATYELVVSHFDRYRGRHRRLKIEKPIKR